MNNMAGMGAQDPLLPRQPSGCRVEEDGWRWDLAAAEAKRLVRLAGPLVASCVLQAAINMVSLMFVGHLGKLPLAGASLATSIANVTGYSVLSGMANAMGTLCGQAFGARQQHLLGVYKQRGMVVLGLASLPIAIVWACAGEILVLMGQDAGIAAEAGVYARWLIPSLAAYVPLQCHVQFLQAQGVVLPITASSCAMVICHAALCWTMVHGAGMGSKGAALSIAVSYAINLAILLYICNKRLLYFFISGVLTGCGLQKIGAAVNLGAFYLAGIPVSVLLAFVFRLNGMGLWLGIVCGSIVKLVLLGFVSSFIDWNTEVVKANGRVFSSSLPIA
ncbi:unnamed protein product [Urochloa humidicola]